MKDLMTEITRRLQNRPDHLTLIFVPTMQDTGVDLIFGYKVSILNGGRLQEIGVLSNGNFLKGSDMKQDTMYTKLQNLGVVYVAPLDGNVLETLENFMVNFESKPANYRMVSDERLRFLVTLEGTVTVYQGFKVLE